MLCVRLACSTSVNVLYCYVGLRGVLQSEGDTLNHLPIPNDRRKFLRRRTVSHLTEKVFFGQPSRTTLIQILATGWRAPPQLWDVEGQAVYLKDLNVRSPSISRPTPQ